MSADQCGEEEYCSSISLVRLCYRYIQSENIEGLALIARQKGLPPCLRYRIWPLLLKKHPFVLNPYINPNYDEDDEDEQADKGRLGDSGRKTNYSENVIPIRKIRSDIKKYFRKNLYRTAHTEELSNDSNKPPATDNDPYHQLSPVERRIFKTLEYSIVKFLRKWGRIFKYESGLAWIALGLAEWYPPLFNNKHYADQNDKYVLLGKDTCLAKFEKKHKDKKICSVYTSSASSKAASETGVNVASATSNSSANLDDSDTNSTTSTYVAETEKLYFNDCNLNETSCIIDLEAETNVLYDGFLQDNEEYNEFNKAMKRLDDSVPLKYKLSFPEIYERLVLIVLHANEPTEEELTQFENSLSGPANTSPQRKNPISESVISLPVKGGTVDERIAFFLHLMRKELSDLTSFFKEEGILTSTYTLNSSGDEWLLYWIKWCGAKAFSKSDRGRLWDLLLGWRPYPLTFSKKNINISAVQRQVQETDDMLIKQLGPDLYWDAVALDKDDKLVKTLERLLINEVRRTCGARKQEEHMHSLALPWLTDLLVIKEKMFPCSIISPHIEYLFVYLSFLKSQENLLFELDQAEIHQVLNNGITTSKASSKFAKKKASKKLKNHHKSYVTYDNSNEQGEKALGLDTNVGSVLPLITSPDTLDTVPPSPFFSPQPNQFTADHKVYGQHLPFALTAGNVTQNEQHLPFALTAGNLTQNGQLDKCPDDLTMPSGLHILNSDNNNEKPEDKRDKILPLVIDKNDDDMEDIIKRSATLWRRWLQRELKPESPKASNE